MKGDEVYLRHIADAIAKVELYVSVGREAFLGASHWQDAVVRQLEVVGEATKRLSSALRARHPDVSWRRIAGLRDVLIHDYMGVDLVAVWEVTQKELPKLKQQVGQILAQETSGPETPEKIPGDEDESPD